MAIKSFKDDLKEEFKEDYVKGVTKLYHTLLPILKKGWTEEEVFNFLSYMEKNTEQFKNKSLDESISIYKNRVQEKI